MNGLKLISHPMLEVRRQCGADLPFFDVEFRLRNGEPAEGYVGVVEEALEGAPVHSVMRGRRTCEFAVADEALAAMQDAGITGLDAEAVESTFPGDEPG